MISSPPSPQTCGAASRGEKRNRRPEGAMGKKGGKKKQAEPEVEIDPDLKEFAREGRERRRAETCCGWRLVAFFSDMERKLYQGPM